ncbi:MAG: HD domain-containing phosphohydrolase [Pseudomonadota bacterium]
MTAGIWDWHLITDSVVSIMKFGSTFLGRNRLAGRIILIFIWCAMVPISVLSFLSYQHVTDQLYQQSQRRLKQSTKTLGMTVYERLLLLETGMKIIASVYKVNKDAALQIQPEKVENRVEANFISMAAVTDQDEITRIYGNVKDVPKPTPAENEHIHSGKTILITDTRSKPYARLFMVRLIDPDIPGNGKLVGEINTPYLWGIGHVNTLPPFVELTVMDHARNPLISSITVPEDFIKKIKYQARESSSFQLEWESSGTTYLSTAWSIFLKPGFHIPEWTVIMTQSKKEIFAPVADVQNSFLMVVFASLLSVTLLSIYYIRKSLAPIEKLKKGTIQIANGDYKSMIIVKTGDEIENLAESFNTMARQLGRQFDMLNTITDIANAILSLTETEKIIGTTLSRMQEVFPCDQVIICLKDTEKLQSMTAYTGRGQGKPPQKNTGIEVCPEDHRLLTDNPDFLLFYLQDDIPSFIRNFDHDDLKLYLVLPILTDGVLSGLIAAGYTKPGDINMKEIPQYRQLTDQVAVALSNAKLINDLKRLNLGALTALARTVDAKSPWTAGHSERVTELSVNVGRMLNLAPAQLEILTRAALLHDIGKIGVPAQILDKKDKLDNEEFARIQMHSRIGARILEPIAAYKDAIPIVLQHHERFDGSGYPNGLCGETITLGARIIAVCDVFDAMASDRPYRKSIPRENVIDLITKESGRQFDPIVVEAFLKIVTPENTGNN